MFPSVLIIYKDLVNSRIQLTKLNKIVTLCWYGYSTC